MRVRWRSPKSIVDHGVWRGQAGEYIAPMDTLYSTVLFFHIQRRNGIIMVYTFFVATVWGSIF